MKKMLIGSLALFTITAHANSFPGLKSTLVHKAGLFCNSMNAQVLSKNDSPFFVRVSGYCGLNGEFHDDVPLKNVTAENDLLKLNGVTCGKISKSDGYATVELNKYHCFFRIESKSTYFNTYQYQGGGDLISREPEGPIRYRKDHKILIDESNVPTVIFGYDWDNSTKKFGTEISRFSSPKLTFKDGEVFYQGRPCGRFVEKSNELYTFEDIRRYSNCQLHYENNGNIYLLSQAKWVETKL